MLGLLTLIGLSSPASWSTETPRRAALGGGPTVSAIELDVRLDPEQGLIHEIATLTVEGRGVSNLEFAIEEGLLVERSRVDEGLIEHRKAGTRLKVWVSPPIDGQRRLTFVVTGRPKGGGGSGVGPQWAALNPSDDWYPRSQHTWATSRVQIHVPEGWTAVAPGRPEPVGDGSFVWRTDKPLRTVALAAAPKLQLSQATVVQTPLRVAAGDKHADGLSETLRDPLSWFSGALAPYPFDGFNLVLLPGFRGRMRAGGMMVVPADTPLGGRPEAADLLAGQWFGELLSGRGSWIDAFSAWQAVTYCRDRTLPLPRDIQAQRQAYFDLPPRKDVPISQATAGAPAAVIRGKGSSAPDMVRLQVDNRSFFQAVRALFATENRPGVPWTLEDVRLVFERFAGERARRPFKEWFDMRGAPQLEARLRTFPAARGGWRVDLTLHQKQGPYALPVEVVLRSAGESHREHLEISEKETALVYTLPFRPSRIEVDPGDRLFRWPVVVVP